MKKIVIFGTDDQGLSVANSIRQNCKNDVTMLSVKNEETSKVNEAVHNAQIIILATKPHDSENLILSISPLIQPYSRKLVISMIPDKTIKSILKIWDEKVFHKGLFE